MSAREDSSLARSADRELARIEAQQNADIADLAEEHWARDEGWAYPHTNDIRRAVA